MAEQAIEYDLDISGMSCASCAARIEKRLCKLPGVEAQVNFATESAHVKAPADMAVSSIISEVEKTGYGASLAMPELASPHADDKELRALRLRLLVSLVLAVPVVAVSMVPALQFDYWQWVLLALTLPVAVWGAWPFHRAAAINLRHGAATMDTLVSIGIIAALSWSLFAMLFGTAGDPHMRHGFALFPVDGAASAVVGSATHAAGHAAGQAVAHSALSNIYLEVAAGVTVFLLAGRMFEKKAKVQARAQLQELANSGAQQVTVLEGESERVIPISALTVGQLFVVRPGEQVAADGEVVAGAAAINKALLTGESVPEEAGVGTQVVGGTIAQGGTITVRATRVGNNTRIAQLARLVAEAQTGKTQAQRLADRVAGVFVPVVLGISALTLLLWLLLSHDPLRAFTAAVAVLIIACPCALGLATPIALLVGTSRGAQLGILIRGPEALERVGRITTVLLDKTGTLTTGKMRLASVVTTAACDEQQLLLAAASVEHRSEHPLGRAIVEAAKQQNLQLLPVDDFSAVPGRYVRGRLKAVGEVTVGALRHLSSAQQPSPQLAARVEEMQQQGQTVVGVAWGGELRSIIGISDTLRETSPAAIRELTKLGLTSVLATGDTQQVGAHIARQLGISRVYAGVLPEQKAEIVRQLQAEGGRVAMVGDGVNDAPALATADLGISMGSGTDAAMAASDITLMRSDPAAIVDAIRLARRTLATIRGNLFWAFAYNLAALPLAATGLLNPMLAGAAMAFSSVFVVGNSLLLKLFKPRLTGQPRATL